jgi:CheY-like chemotaxis protein
MSHELRTPLNSLLILAKLLTENKDKNLTGKQVEFAQTIYSSGTDLLNLINDILDLSKVEAGKMEVNVTDVTVRDVTDFVERTFRPVAEQKGLSFTVDAAPDSPSPIFTDGQRLQQVLKNLLSNAFKFTERGNVTLSIRRADKGRRFAARTLDKADDVIAFGVKDTGIGIAREKQQLIFEAFQQADGTTSRKYGGTGLGLSISREIARLLGGEIHVESTPAQGSTFTLFLPVRYLEQDRKRLEDELMSGPRPERLRSQAATDRAAARASSRERENASASPRPALPPAREAERRVPTSSAPAASASGGATTTSSSTTGVSASISESKTAEPSDSWKLPDLSSIGMEDASDSSDAGVETLAPPMEDLPRPHGFEDDRDDLQPGDRVVLIVEDDANFAHILLDLARDKGYKGIVGHDGEVGLQLAHAYRPDAITLDIDMPGIDGWAVLDRLKHHPDTRHIPVHIITGIRERQQGLKAGAIAYLEKPVTKEALDDSFNRISHFIDQQVKRLLVVEDDDVQRAAMIDLIAHEDVEITAVATAEEALRELAQTHYDCMVLDLGLQGGQDGFQLLETVKGDPAMRELPIIIYTGKELSQEEETRLRRFADTIIIKDVKSPERLLDETALFLHRVEAKLPEQKRRMLERLHNADAVFAGKHVLIVDDDVRNIFSLTSVLEDHGMRVSFAENGRQAIDLLKGTPDVDLVLMDVMMPEMDGYETTRAIRQISELRNLPIIALTAKAMKGDREKCIAAGASDYITKPVDTEQLLSLMRVWLYR